MLYGRIYSLALQAQFHMQYLCSPHIQYCTGTLLPSICRETSLASCLPLRKRCCMGLCGRFTCLSGSLSQNSLTMGLEGVGPAAAAAWFGAAGAP